MTTKLSNHECCPPFDPVRWMEGWHEWQEKKFVRGKVRTFFNIPLNFRKVIRSILSKSEAVGAENSDFMFLSDQTSLWNMDIYVAVDREVPDADNISISGRYISQVYNGSYWSSGKWMELFLGFVARKNLKTGKIYKWYATCPKCTRASRKNYVVIFAEMI